MTGPPTPTALLVAVGVGAANVVTSVPHDVTSAIIDFVIATTAGFAAHRSKQAHQQTLDTHDTLRGVIGELRGITGALELLLGQRIDHLRDRANDPARPLPTDALRTE